MYSQNQCFLQSRHHRIKSILSHSIKISIDQDKRNIFEVFSVNLFFIESSRKSLNTLYSIRVSPTVRHFTLLDRTTLLLSFKLLPTSPSFNCNIYLVTTDWIFIHWKFTWRRIKLFSTLSGLVTPKKCKIQIDVSLIEICLTAFLSDISHMFKYDGHIFFSMFI